MDTDVTSAAIDDLRAALDAAEDAVVVTDAEGIILEANLAAARMNGIGREDAIGRHLVDVGKQVGADEAELAAVREAIAGRRDSYETHRRTSAGAVVATTVTITATATGHLCFVTPGLQVHRERSSRGARERLRTDVARSIALARGLEDTLGAFADLLVGTWADALLVLIADEHGALTIGTLRTVDTIDAELATQRLPASLGDANAGGPLATVARDHAPLLVAGDPRITQLGVGSMIAVPMLAENRLRGVLCVGTAVSARPYSDADVPLFVTLAENAAQGIRAAGLHEAMLAAQNRFRAAFDAAPIGAAVLRPEGDDAVYVAVNPAWCAIVGLEHDQILGEPSTIATHEAERAGERERIRALTAGEVTEISTEKRIVRGDGHDRWVHVRSAALGDGTFVTMMQDVTDARQAQQELEHLASHDALTGLLNRRRFESALDEALANVRRHGDHAAVVTLDIDNFKHVNDTYGHTIGDELLLAIAAALKVRVRETDYVGRLGGDEFGVVLTRADAGASHAVALELLAAVREATISVGGHKVRVTASAGLRPLSPEDARDAGELLSEADMAMYDAKERGRDRLSTLGDQQPQRVRARIGWSERVRDALDDSGDTRFTLYEQPIMCLADGSTDHSELLIRMRTGDGVIHPPASFLGVAERYGQIQAIDRWVVARAVQLLAGRPGHTFEVNLAGESISDRDVIDFVVAAVRGADIDPSNLIFEVTETSAVGNLQRARELAGRLTDLGCGFALDDFGAGFGSFAYLKHLPLSIIKIDGQFVRSLTTSAADQVTVRAIVDVARGLGKETVAEFVEDEETLELLRELGVDRAQGYHIGRPAPVK